MITVFNVNIIKLKYFLTILLGVFDWESAMAKNLQFEQIQATRYFKIYYSLIKNATDAKEFLVTMKI